MRESGPHWTWHERTSLRAPGVAAAVAGLPLVNAAFHVLYEAGKRMERGRT